MEAFTGERAVPPYGMSCEHDNPVQVIWHNDERVQFDFFPYRCGTGPFRFDNPASLVEVHLPSNYLPKHARLSPGTDRHEVCPRSRVVVSRKADRSTVRSAAHSSLTLHRAPATCVRAKHSPNGPSAAKGRCRRVLRPYGLNGQRSASV